MYLKPTITIAFIALLGISSMTAQASKVFLNADSLIALLPGIEDDSVLLSTYYQISRTLNNQNPAEAYRYNSLGFSKAKALRDEVFMASFSNEVGLSFYFQSQPDSAIYYFKLGSALYKKLGDEENASMIEGNIGLIYIEKGDYKAGIEHYTPLLDEAILKNDSILIVNYTGNIGLAYDYMGDYEKAMEYYVGALEKAKAYKNYRQVQLNLSNLGALYSFLGEDDKAKGYFLEAIPLNISFDNNNELARNYQNLGLIYDYAEKNDSALYLHEKALEIYRKTNRLDGIVDEYLNIGAIYEKLNELDKAEDYFMQSLSLKEKIGSPERLIAIYINLGSLYGKKARYNQAESYLKKAEKIALDLGVIMRQQEVYVALSLLYEAKGDYRRALSSYKKYKSATDSLLNAEKTEAIVRIEQEFESKKRIAENEEFKLETELHHVQIRQDKWLKIFGGTGIILLLIMFALLLSFYNKQKKISLELQQKNEQIRLLNREINHRVKNNLVFMTGLLEMQARRLDIPEAKQAVRESESRLRALSLVHTSLFKDKNARSINLKSYIAELTYNLKNIFSLPEKTLLINTSIQEISLDAEDTMRIGLIVNELITNSIKHAFSAVDHPQIDLEIKKDRIGRLLLHYADNGSGMTWEKFELKKDSLGLKLIMLLTEQMHGACEVEYGEGQGYRFVFG